MSVSLIDLPYELLIMILNKCDNKSIHNIYKVNEFFKNIIDNSKCLSIKMRYTLTAVKNSDFIYHADYYILNSHIHTNWCYCNNNIIENEINQIYNLYHINDELKPKITNNKYDNKYDNKSEIKYNKFIKNTRNNSNKNFRNNFRNNFNYRK